MEIWGERYKTGSPLTTYSAYYRSALHGNKISVARMNVMADEYAMGRLKGKK